MVKYEITIEESYSSGWRTDKPPRRIIIDSETDGAYDGATSADQVRHMCTNLLALRQKRQDNIHEYARDVRRLDEIN